LRGRRTIDKAVVMGLGRGWAILGVFAGLSIAGCTAVGNGPGADRTDLVSDLATRLGRAETLTYTADYQLAGGQPATVARAATPRRAAYSYPGGKLIIVPGTTTDCRPAGGASRCTRAPLASPEPDLPPAMIAQLRDNGFVTATLVIGLLNATALDSDATIAQRDTTLAGQHATCVRVEAVDNAAASTFEACVTTDGVLGSFSGTVNGVRVDLAMTRYRATVTADAFDTPAGAQLVGAP
jgi:hypothetical protein